MSVDRLFRADLSGRFRLAYKVRGLRPEDLLPTWKLIGYRLSQASSSLKFRLGGGLRAAATTILEPIRPKAPGIITLYRQRLNHLSELSDDSFDAVVSVSALEHNRKEDLPEVVAELLRVLKPGGLLLATLAAARDEDRYHEPSGGWCLTEQSQRSIFALSPNSRSNFSEYDSLLRKIRENKVLPERLAPMFFRSGDNGMPWGIWDPKYMPVGIQTRKK